MTIVGLLIILLSIIGFVYFNVKRVDGIEKRKFKVGDIIYDIDLPNIKKEVVAIINKKQVYKGNWKSIAKYIYVENSYVVKDFITKKLTYFNFNEEKCYELFQSFSVKICPRCNRKLAEKVSTYTNTTIQKCNYCGWC